MKDKGFSSKNKVQRYHGDGRESIIVMGRPFRVIENLSAPTKESRRRLKKDSMCNTTVFLVENTSHLSAFPPHFALKRSIFNIDQVSEAHHEIEMFSRISDKNIVKSYHCEVSRHEGKLGASICTEYCANTLWKRIKNGGQRGTGSRLSEGEIASLLIGVTSALGYLHAQQPPIAYRNIHPENILISNKFTGPAMYKLCNFSLASTEAFQCVNREEASKVTEDSEKYSSMAFVAPEMADPFARKRIDEQVDMWALGVLLYSVMYMKLPFEPTITTLSKNPRYHVSSNSNYSGSFQTILQHLLDPDPQSRWNVFALTNFLRFDEAIERHLSTFCFTYTEYPEGWEEQSVSVVGRPVPAKNAPVTYAEGAAVARVGGAATVGDSENEVDETFHRPLPVASSSSPSTPDAGFQHALTLLEETGDIDDPRIARYKDAIIRQQTAMWSNATGQPDATPSPRTPPPPPPKDELEDLFGTAATPPSTNTNAQHADPLAAAFGAVQLQPGATKADPFNADDLFAPLPSPPMTMPPYAVPAAGFAGYPAPGYAAPQGFTPPPGTFNPQAGGNGFYGGAPMPQPMGMMSGPPRPNPPIDFLSPSGGAPPRNQNETTNNAANAPGPALAKKTDVPGSKAKDPFSDLFNF